MSRGLGALAMTTWALLAGCADPHDGARRTARAGAPFDLLVDPGGRVTSSAGSCVGSSACDTTCMLDVPESGVITFTAEAEPTSIFLGWEGACVGRAPACRVDVAAARQLRARFAPPAAATGWTRAFQGGGIAEAGVVARLSSGRVVVAGGASGSAIDLGGGSRFATGAADIFLAVYDTDGVHVWSARTLGGSTAQVSHLVATSDGGFILSGTYGGTGVDLGGVDLPDSGIERGFLARLDGNGQGLWADTFAAESFLRDLAVDGQDRVVALGGSSVDITFGGVTHTAAPGSLEFSFVARWTAAGTRDVLRPMFTTANQVIGVLTTMGEQVVVTGTFTMGLDVGGLTLAAADRDGFIATFDGALSPSSLISFGSGPGEVYFTGLAASPAGDLIITGAADLGVELGAGSPIASPGSFLASHGAAGLRFVRPLPGALPYLVEVQGDSIVIAGEHQGAHLGGDVLWARGVDLYVGRFALDGTHQGSWGFGSEADESVVGLAVDPSGHVVLTGMIRGAMDFGPGPMQPSLGNERAGYVAFIRP